MSLKSVILIGGGLAGLSAGVALAEAGYRVRLFEKRPFLGGRATSYVLPNGDHVDNCQHVTFGCCTNLEDFYRRVGSADKIRFFDRLVLQDPQGRRGVLKAGILPVPLHLATSFAFFAPLAVRDKLSIARAVWDILKSGGRPPDLYEGRDVSMLEWLDRRKQTPAAMAKFWRPVLVSALDEELDRTDARYGVDVIWKAVLTNRAGYRMGVPCVPLGELYEDCRQTLERRGGEITYRAPARRLLIENGAMKGVSFDQDRVETADAYVSAVTPDILDELLPAQAKQDHAMFRNLGKLKAAPITGVHFWFDRRVMTEPYLNLLETVTQWIFNKTFLYGKAHGGESPSGQYLQLVISASYDLLQKPRQEIIDLCLTEVRQALPAARQAVLVKATVIKEAAATLSPEPGVDRWRLKQETDIGGLFLAGDWTVTGWPATMEGAVRSGYLAAEAILAADGIPQKIVRPDLPVEGFSRFWARNSG